MELHLIENLKDFFVNPEVRNLNSVALRAREIAKGEKHKEAAKEKREHHLAYDDLEHEDSEEFQNFGPVRVFLIAGLVTIGLVTMFFLIF